MHSSCTCSGTTTRRFVGHTKDVMSVAFSADNRQIVSGSRDHTIKLWNTLGVCKYTIQVCWLVCWCVACVQSSFLSPFSHRMTVTLTGSVVFVSLRMLRIPSLCPVDGTSW